MKIRKPVNGQSAQKAQTYPISSTANTLQSSRWWSRAATEQKWSARARCKPGAKSGDGSNGEVHLMPEWQSAEAGGGGTAGENCTCRHMCIGLQA